MLPERIPFSDFLQALADERNGEAIYKKIDKAYIFLIYTPDRSGGRYPPPRSEDVTWPISVQAGGLFPTMRSHQVADAIDGQPCVMAGRLDPRMAQEDLDVPDIHPSFQQMGSEGVAERMRRDVLGDPGVFGRLLHRPAQDIDGEGLVGDGWALEQPDLGLASLDIPLAERAYGRRHLFLRLRTGTPSFSGQEASPSYGERIPPPFFSLTSAIQWADAAKYAGLITLALALGACSPKRGVSPPHEARFDVSHAGTRFCEAVRISSRKPYMFYLNFHYDSEGERAQTMDVFGFGEVDEKRRPRLVVSVKLDISKQNQDGSRIPVYDKQIETNGINSDSVSASYHGSLSRLIDYVDMEPGFYDVCVESMGDVPYLYNKWVDFGISWSPGLK